MQGNILQSLVVIDMAEMEIKSKMFVAQPVDCDATSFGRVRSELAGIIFSQVW